MLFIYHEYLVFYTICRKHPVKMSFVRVRRSNSAGIPRKQKTHKKKPAWDVSETCTWYDIYRDFASLKIVCVKIFIRMPFISFWFQNLLYLGHNSRFNNTEGYCRRNCKFPYLFTLLILLVFKNTTNKIWYS